MQARLLHARTRRGPRAAKTPLFVTLSVAVAVAVVLAVVYEPWNLVRHGSATPPLPAATDLEAPLSERIQERVAAVRAEPYDAAAWGRLGETYDVHEMFPEAIACYERARELAPEDPRWPYLLGVAQRIGDQRAALRSFEAALALDPSLPAAQFHAGHAYLAAGALEQAERAFTRVTELAPQEPGGHVGLAKVALAKDEPQRALEALERARALAPKTSEARWLSAAAWRALGDEAKAASFAGPGDPRPSEEGFPDLLRRQMSWDEGVTLHFARQRAETRLARGEREEALGELRRYLEQVPRSAKALLALADMHMKLDQPAEALSRYQAALTIDPSDAAGLSQWAIALARTGKPEQGIAKLRQALELEPTRPEFQTNLGSLLAGAGTAEERQEGLRLLAQAAQARLGDAGLQVNLAQALRANGRHDEALAAFERALAIAPDDLRVRFEHGVLCAVRGRLDDAARAFARVVEADPTRHEARDNLVRALAQSGRHREALEALRAAIAVDPERVEWRVTLAWMLSTSPDDGIRSGSEALALIEPLVQASQEKNPELLVVRAAAQAEAGDLAAAIASVAKALELMQPKPPEIVQDPALVGIIERALACLKAFNEGKPFRVGAP